MSIACISSATNPIRGGLPRPSFFLNRTANSVSLSTTRCKLCLTARSAMASLQNRASRQSVSRTASIKAIPSMSIRARSVVPCPDASRSRLFEGVDTRKSYRLGLPLGKNGPVPIHRKAALQGFFMEWAAAINRRTRSQSKCASGQQYATSGLTNLSIRHANWRRKWVMPSRISWIVFCLTASNSYRDLA